MLICGTLVLSLVITQIAIQIAAHANLIAHPNERSSHSLPTPQVGGIGIAPGANIGGAIAVYEATHGTAPKYAGQDKVNPGSIILSAEMMLRDMGWGEAADLIIQGISGAIAAKTVTYDFERLMPGATLLRCSEFGQAVIENMDK